MRKLSEEQTRCLASLIDYTKENERNHLEECLCEVTDDDTSSYTDDDLYQFCMETDSDYIKSHIWLKIHKLSELLN